MSRSIWHVGALGLRGGCFSTRPDSAWTRQNNSRSGDRPSLPIVLLLRITSSHEIFSSGTVVRFDTFDPSAWKRGLLWCQEVMLFLVNGWFRTARTRSSQSGQCDNDYLATFLSWKAQIMSYRIRLSFVANSTCIEVHVPSAVMSNIDLTTTFRHPCAMHRFTSRLSSMHKSYYLMPSKIDLRFVLILNVFRSFLSSLH